MCTFLVSLHIQLKAKLIDQFGYGAKTKYKHKSVLKRYKTNFKIEIKITKLDLIRICYIVVCSIQLI